MAREFKNGFGVSYRALSETAEELEHIFIQGEQRLSPEEIGWRRDALKELNKIHSRIRAILDEFEKIAPPRVRTEPPKEKLINN